jgi:hypothetical protein
LIAFFEPEKRLNLVTSLLENIHQSTGTIADWI